ncbi:MAG: hypothetical protein OEY41_16305, partial [Acidimicrobiia bacterium]|nr:hypothetical protein [Acidimicrobiia bacterium]
MAWVLGAQAPTAVRSQKMDDVIFAGTASRKALGRAEVSLTIDNADGQLPIEFNEVTIARTLFRSGDSDYQINGVSCRLLDIQELLSDSGVGRQQHIIVSQGRIDDVLNAKPEERRSIIEEAAGVLKYRKRKERAERRLTATEENLHRLQDLLREVRRQVRPLEKQAAAARRHDSLVAELTTLKIHLTGRELRSLRAQLETAHRQRLEANGRERTITSQLASLDAAVLRDESRLAALGASDIADVASRARSLRERIRGQHNVIGERRRRLEGELQAAVDDGLVANLEAESARLAEELQTAEADARRLKPEFERLARAEALLSSEQLTFDTEWGDELAPKPTRAPELRAELAALAKAGQRSQAELQRLGSELQASAARRQRVEAEAAQASQTLTQLATERPEMDRQAAAAQQERRTAEAAVTELTEQRRDADAEAHRWAARRDALRQALDAARSAAGATALADQAGFLGVLLDLVAIDEGWESAVEAAAGEALQAVVIDNPRNGAAALAALEANDLAGAVLALGRAAGSVPAVGAVPAGAGPVGAVRLRDRVRAQRDDVNALLDALFASAAVVDGTWRQAMEVAMGHPELVVVTRHGDRFGPAGWRIGLSGTGATGAALEEAEGKAAFAKGEAERVAAALQAGQAAARDAVNRSRSIEDRRRQAAQAQERATGLRDRSSAQLRDFAADAQRLEERRAELAAQARADEGRAARLRAELPAVENEEAEYLKRVEALSHSRTSLEERTRALAQARRDLEVKGAAIDARQEQLVSRRAETETRLERLVG